MKVRLIIKHNVHTLLAHGIMRQNNEDKSAKFASLHSKHNSVKSALK